MIHYDLLFDGPRLQWPGQGFFRATSGLRGRQFSDLQCDPDGGPIPEGSYFFLLGEEPPVPIQSDKVRASGRLADSADPVRRGGGRLRTLLGPVGKEPRAPQSHRDRAGAALMPQEPRRRYVVTPRL